MLRKIIVFCLIDCIKVMTILVIREILPKMFRHKMLVEDFGQYLISKASRRLTNTIFINFGITPTMMDKVLFSQNRNAFVQFQIFVVSVLSLFTTHIVDFCTTSFTSVYIIKAKFAKQYLGPCRFYFFLSEHIVYFKKHLFEGNSFSIIVFFGFS